jgi:hypothetical protein
MKLMNPDLTSMQTNDLFQRIDQDGNHCISFIEFLAATLDPDDVDANELKQVRVYVGLFPCTCVPDLYCNRAMSAGIPTDRPRQQGIHQQGRCVPYIVHH